MGNILIFSQKRIVRILKEIVFSIFRYVEKQQFLERADYRRFEIEKAAREKSRKTFNK